MFSQRSKRIVAMALKPNYPDDIHSDTDNEIIEDTESEYLPSDSKSNTESEFSDSNQLSPEIPIAKPLYASASFSYSTTLPISCEASQQSLLDENLENTCLEENVVHNYTEMTPVPLNEEMVANKTQENAYVYKVNKRRIRRKHCCLFCEVEVKNFIRHLERHHSDEFAVQEIINLPKNSKQRKKLIDKLRKEGDFCTANVVPVMSLADKENSEYIICKFCKGYYTRKSLRRHAKKCFFNPDPSKRFNAQIEGQTIMVGHFGPNDSLRVSGLLNMMRADDVSMVAKKDAVICEVARRYIRSHKEKHLLLVAKRYMRRLARLLINIRNIAGNQKLQMIDILTPNKFKNLITATRNVAEYDQTNRTYKSPSLALQMGTLIKTTINAAYSMEIQKPEPIKERVEQFKLLTTLIENDWAHEISSEAGQNLALNKFNKPTLIPMAEDIMKFEKYLDSLITKSKHELIENSRNAKAYRNLTDAIFCSLMTFNKRRVGELQRMSLLSFIKNYETTSSSEFEKALSESEKILTKSLKRVVIRGKRGRGVPVLFNKKLTESIEFMIQLRENFSLADNPFLFGLPNTEGPITGTVIMRKHAKLALGDIKKASLLTSTKLRKHLATITQILKMEKNELEQLASFMGHTEKTHAEFYRLPSDIYQTAKISKLLLISKTGAIDKFKGKSLADIEINEIGNEIAEENESDDDVLDDNSLNLEQEIEELPRIRNEDEPAPKRTKIKKGPKRVLIAWTEMQKEKAQAFFKTHIKKRLAPKKHEVMQLVEENESLYNNKTWQAIKVYVCNQFKK